MQAIEQTSKALPIRQQGDSGVAVIVLQILLNGRGGRSGEPVAYSGKL